MGDRFGAEVGGGYSIGERSQEGYAALTLIGGELEASFSPAAGMVGCSLRHRGEEMLGTRHGLAAYAEAGRTMGIPLLHPWANRLGATSFALAGGSVSLDPRSSRVHPDEHGLPIHGLLAGDPGWRVERHEAGVDGALLSAVYRFADPRLLEMFPFPHAIALGARLTAGALTISTTVEADAGSPVPISFGFHPYLRLPGVERAEWEIEVPVRERVVLDGRGLPTGERLAGGVPSGRLGARTFDDAFAAPPGGDPFVLRGGGRRVEVALGTGYPFTQLFAPPDDAVVCFEPRTAPTNALVTGGPELTIVDPGATYDASFSIAIGDG
jgi:galactose mutarotase-like enzyme